MIILILILIFQTTTPIIVCASETNTYFAKIMFDQVYLYRSPIEDDSASNIYFILPKTYFVELTDEDGDFYKVNYLDLTGYVKKQSVQAIEGKPNTPYLNNITFRVYAELSQNLRSAPNLTNSNQISFIPNLTKNITYYGELSGECLIEGRTNIWYFCKYNNNEQTYYGYVYSDFCDEMPAILENNESVKFIDNPSFVPVVETPKAIPVKSNFTGIIIGILSIPALIFVLLIIKGKQILTKDKLKNKEVIDY